MFNFIKTMFQSKPELTKLIKDGAVIVDVRTKAEYQSGHIDGSRNIPLENIRGELLVLKQLNKPVITVCRSGNRSEMAKSILAVSGIQAYNGGAWTNLQSQILSL